MINSFFTRFQDLKNGLSKFVLEILYFEYL